MLASGSGAGARRGTIYGHTGDSMREYDMEVGLVRYRLGNG